MPSELPNRDLTVLLQAVRDGEAGSSDELLQAVYSELRKLARSRMGREQPGQTLQATALVHEAWLRIDGGKGDSDWNDRRHFFGAASRAMRQILVERHRRVNQVKRGGEWQRAEDADLAAIQMPDSVGEGNSDSLDLVALDAALRKLEERDPRMAEIVELRYFCGLSVEDTAEAMGLSPRTVKREWAVARGFLFRQIG